MVRGLAVVPSVFSVQRIARWLQPGLPGVPEAGSLQPSRHRPRLLTPMLDTSPRLSAGRTVVIPLVEKGS